MSTHHSNDGLASSKKQHIKIQQVQPIPISEEELEQQPLLHREFLDPGDPQVSALNLNRVRLLRLVVAGLLFINVVLFLLLLISDFITIPGFFNRGKSFLELDLLVVAIFANLITIWYFDVPAYLERVVGYIAGALIAIDIVIILSIATLRGQFGLLGGFILIWTCCNILFDSIANYYVETGRNYQEIRLTGRIETRRSIGELLIIFLKSGFKIGLLLIIWNISLTLWLSAFDLHEKPWGELVSVDDDKFNIHLACYGDVTPDRNNTDQPKQPIILVEGGQLTSSEVFQEWIQELYQLDKIERYCIWDRPGYGWSDSAPSPVSIGVITDFLIEALEKKGIEGPFSLVGFDIGGLYSRMFASRRPAQIHSLLMVDSWHEDLLKVHPFSGTNRKNEPDNVFNNILELMDISTGLSLWIKGVISPLGIYQNLHWIFHPRKYSSKSRIFGSDMYWSSQYLRARLQEQVTSSILSYGEVKAADIHDLPMSVISSDFMIKKSLNWGKWQREISKLSTNTIEWVIAENSSHFIWQSPKGREQLQQLLLRLVSERRNYETLENDEKVEKDEKDE